MAKGLFLKSTEAKTILDELVRQGLISVVADSPDVYRYETAPDRDRLMTLVHAAYRRELIRISRLLHSKASPAVREFAKAFRLKKEPR